MAEFNLEGLLGNAFGGGTGNFLDEYLTPEQRAMMQRNAMLAASAALLKAGGESTRRIGIGEALGGAFEAGQAGYEKAQTGALTQMALKQKMDEAKKAKELQKLIAGVFAPPAAAPVGAAIQPAAPMPNVGDTYTHTFIEGDKAGTSEQRTVTQEDLAAVQKYNGPQVQLPSSLTAPVQGMATPMNQNVARANQYRKAAQMLNMAGQGEQAMKYEDLAYKLDPQSTSTGTALSKLIAERAALPAGSPMIPIYTSAIEKEAQNAPPAPKAGTLLSQLQADLAGATDPEIRSQIKSRIQKEINNPPPAQNIVNINEGQKGFENEMKLAAAFKGEPIVKEFSDMQSAYGQVISSLAQGTPIGDVAGATKVMKLLDPGSVVRESELGIAMAAGGRMDRLQNYFNNFMTGQKLTPTQRQDFNALSNELYAAAGQAYNKKRNEYLSVGQTYKFPNMNTVLGAPASVPSVVRQPGGSFAAPGGGRPALNNIFGIPGN